MPTVDLSSSVARNRKITRKVYMSNDLASFKGIHPLTSSLLSQFMNLRVVSKKTKLSN